MCDTVGPLVTSNTWKCNLINNNTIWEVCDVKLLLWFHQRTLGSLLNCDSFMQVFFTAQ